MKRKGEASRIVEELRIGEEMICAGLDQTCGGLERIRSAFRSGGKDLQLQTLYQSVTELICDERNIPENSQIDWLS